MHAVVIDNLEEYLTGTLEPATHREIEAHLGICTTCREEVHSMRDVSQLFASMRSEEVVEPSGSFFAGIMQKAGERRAAPSFASLFGFDFAFGRRLAFASLLTLAIVGTCLVSREIEYSTGPSAEAVMAQQESPSFDSAPAQDNMLMTLTAYEQH